MSVVCAKVYDDCIVFAADTGLYLGDAIIPSNGFSKLFTCNGVTVGSCGGADELALMRNFVTSGGCPTAPSEIGILDFMKDFYLYAQHYRNAAPEFAKVTSEDDPKWNSFIIGYAGHAFVVEGTMVYEITDYAACGAGEPYATTALHLGCNPCEAVAAAAELCVYVRTPMHSVSIERR